MWFMYGLKPQGSWFVYGLKPQGSWFHGCVLRDNRSRQGVLRVVTNSEKKLCFFSLSQIFGVPLHLEVTYAWLI